MRFVVFDVGRNLLPRVVTDIGRVRHDVLHVQVRRERLEQVAVAKLDLVGHAMLLGIVAGRSKSVIMAPLLWRSSRERCVLVIATKHSFWR